jgi:hypothetical protein
VCGSVNEGRENIIIKDWSVLNCKGRWCPHHSNEGAGKEGYLVALYSHM